MTEIVAARLIQDRKVEMRVGATDKQSESKETFWRKLVSKSPFWRKLVGWTCLALGVFGIILPIIPGIPFLVAGLALLSTEYRWVRSLLIWTKRKLGRWWPQKIKIPRVRRGASRRKDHPL
jgi:hypothetical protein